ncbi:MAG: heme o synthase [Pirellulales bacterium]|nr:heme o synthase [Pirellulales bacterium]
MSTSVVSSYASRSQGWALVRDYVELTKPRIAMLVLVTVVVGAFVGGWGPNVPPLVLLHALIGTTLVAASASAFNQWLERKTDARMARTADRPLPAGRLGSREVIAFGSVTLLTGVVWLLAAVNLLAALLGVATWVIYVCIYTPLKSRTTLNTIVGAVAGALPVLIGWAAVEGRIGLPAATLFTIVYLWQFPHFMAIAFLYREDYARAGLKMLGSVEGTLPRAGAHAVTAALALVPVSVLPFVLQLAGPIYLSVAVALGAAYAAASLRFARTLDRASARRLLRVSLVYLPALLVLLMLVPLFYPWI